jgi:hypothetical protein
VSGKRDEIIKSLMAASTWLQDADAKSRSEHPEVSGHARAAQHSINAALGALNKTKDLAS